MNSPTEIALPTTSALPDSLAEDGTGTGSLLENGFALKKVKLNAKSCLAYLDFIKHSKHRTKDLDHKLKKLFEDKVTDPCEQELVSLQQSFITTINAILGELEATDELLHQHRISITCQHRAREEHDAIMLLLRGKLDSKEEAVSNENVMMTKIQAELKAALAEKKLKRQEIADRLPACTLEDDAAETMKKFHTKLGQVVESINDCPNRELSLDWPDEVPHPDDLKEPEVEPTGVLDETEEIVPEPMKY